MKSFKKLSIAVAISSTFSLSHAQCVLSGGSGINCNNGTFYTVNIQNSSSGDVVGQNITLTGTTKLNESGAPSIKGGYTENGNATNNSVDVSGELAGVVRSIFGGETENGNAIGNSVKFSDWKTDSSIFGGSTNSGNANNNTVIINSGYIYKVIGGFSVSGSVSSNKVDINGGNVNDGDITGGETDDGNALDNTVNINGGSITDSTIIGGYTEDGKASGNEVNINNKVKALVIGGDSIGGEASGNIVNIAGEISAVPNHDIWAETDYPDKNIAVIGGYTGTGKAINNTVNFLSGQVNGTIYGGFSLGDDDNNNVSQDVLAGNTLNIGTADKAAPMNTLKTENIFNFENINFYLPQDVKNGDTALELTTTDKTDLSKSTVSAYLDNATHLTKDSTVNLIKTAGTLNNPKATNTRVSIAGLINVAGKIALANNDTTLQLSFEDRQNGVGNNPNSENNTGNNANNIGTNTTNTKNGNETGKITTEGSNNSVVVPIQTITNNDTTYAEHNSKLILESQLTGTALVEQAGNFLDDTFLSAKSNNDGATSMGVYPFVKAGGFNKKVKTGSHIDVKGGNLNVGIGADNGNFNSALFVEHGKGHWDSHLDNGANGSGKSYYTGGGVFAQHNIILSQVFMLRAL